MEILLFPEAAVPAQLRRQVIALQDQAWPQETAQPPSLAPIHDPAVRPLSMLLVQDARVVSALDILSKELDHGGTRFQASGISTVVTSRTERRKGFGDRLAVGARDQMEAAGADIALFTCDTTLRGFYECAGFTVMPGTVVVGGTLEEPLPSDQFDKVTLACFFTERARQAATSFEHARIELYPGGIDRLW